MSVQNKNRKGEFLKKGYFMAIVSAICFGTAGILVKFSLLEGLTPITLLALQYTFAVISMFIIQVIKNPEGLRVNRNQLYNLLILGVMGNTFMTVFYYKAFEYLPVANVTMLLFTYPVMVFLYSIVFDNKKVQIKGICAILLAFIGAIFTLNVFNEGLKISIIGLTYGVLCAIFYAFMNIYSEKKLNDVSSFSINAYSTLFSLIALYIYVNPINLIKVNISFQGFISIMLLAIICEIIPLTLLYSALKDIGYIKVSIIGNLEIPTSMLGGYLMLSEKINFFQVAGAFMIISAIFLIKEEQK